MSCWAGGPPVPGSPGSLLRRLRGPDIPSCQAPDDSPTLSSGRYVTLAVNQSLERSLLGRMQAPALDFACSDHIKIGWGRPDLNRRIWCGWTAFSTCVGGCHTRRPRGTPRSRLSCCRFGRGSDAKLRPCLHLWSYSVTVAKPDGSRFRKSKDAGRRIVSQLPAVPI